LYEEAQSTTNSAVKGAQGIGKEIQTKIHSTVFIEDIQKHHLTVVYQTFFMM